MVSEWLTWTMSVLYFRQTSSTDILCSVCRGKKWSENWKMQEVYRFISWVQMLQQNGPKHTKRLKILEFILKLKLKIEFSEKKKICLNPPSPNVCWWKIQESSFSLPTERLGLAWQKTSKPSVSLRSSSYYNYTRSLIRSHTERTALCWSGALTFGVSDSRSEFGFFHWMISFNERHEQQH